MPYVLTVDQRASRRSPDRVPDVLRRLNSAVPTVLGFERTAGDEFQGVIAEADDVVEIVLQLVRSGDWSIGIGAGPVHTPLPQSTRAGAGPAFLSARRAVDAAKQRPTRLAVRGRARGRRRCPGRALGARRRRGAPQRPGMGGDRAGRAGHTQAEAATELGISRQAVGQRLAAGLWDLERELRPTAARLLTRAAG